MPLDRSPQRTADIPQATPSHNSSAAQMETPQTPETATLAVTKIPPFWRSNPKLWFAQVETVFRINKITRGDTKFDHILAILDSATLEFISDIVLSPPAEGCKYEALKKKLIASFAESEEKKLRRLLTVNTIGDQKPTHFLQFMRNSGGGQVSDSLLKAIFMEQMPDNIRAILIGNKGTLDEVAEQADKIMEQLSPSISAVSTSGPMTTILDKIDLLEKRFNELKTRFRSSSPSSSTSNGQQRSRSRSRSRSMVQGWCWYHNNFKDKALKCTAPCSYSKN